MPLEMGHQRSGVRQPNRTYLALNGHLSRMCFLHMCVQGKKIVTAQVAEPTSDFGMVMFNMEMSHSKVAVRAPAYCTDP